MLAQTEARLHALQQLQQHIDNDKNLNAWLQQHQLDKLPRLWQSIRIENGWEDALEAVLRERLNAIAMPVAGGCRRVERCAAGEAGAFCERGRPGYRPAGESRR